MRCLPVITFLSSAALGTLAGCAEDYSPPCYGCDEPYPEPGDRLAEGGGLLHDRAFRFGAAEQSTVSTYQFDGPPPSANAPFPTPTESAMGTCVDERIAMTASWPFRPITGATYLDLATPTVSADGLAPVMLAKVAAPDPASSWTFRSVDFEYAAAAPNESGTYQADIGKGDPMRYFMPDSYVPPLGIGGADTVVLSSRGDLELTWDPPAQDDAPRRQAFDFVYFATPELPFAPQFMCFPDVAGHMVIPKTVLDALPPAGVVFHIRMTHYREAREGAYGELRRFDLVGSVSNESKFEKP